MDTWHKVLRFSNGSQCNAKDALVPLWNMVTSAVQHVELPAGTDTHSDPSSLYCWWECGRCGGRDPCQASCVILCPLWPCRMLMWCRSRRPYAVAPASKRSPCTPPRGLRRQLPTSCSCETATSWRVRGLLSARRVRAETFQLVAAAVELTLLTSPEWKWCADKERWLTFRRHVPPTRHCANFVCVRLEGHQWRPLVAEAMRVV